MCELAKSVKNLALLGLVLTSVLVTTNVAPALEVGEKAPDFTLPSTTGENISLHQFQGKKNVLVEFYVRDFGPTWIKNLSARVADYQKFQDMDIQVLAVSADDTFSQKTFADSLKSPFPFLSNPDLTVIKNYAGLQPHPKDPTKQVSLRGLFLIDKQGIVRGKWVGATADFFPSEEILKVAQSMAGKS
jgi:peroxiredoxin